MVWGGMSLAFRTPLHRVDGTLNGVAYRDQVLGPLVLPALQAMGPGATLMDDNAPAHRSRVVQAFLQDEGVERMNWPACSPDLNPIEHLWDALGRGLRANHPPPVNLVQLYEFLDAEWQAIPQRTLRTLVESMRQRCVECINARGGHTRF